MKRSTKRLKVIPSKSKDWIDDDIESCESDEQSNLGDEPLTSDEDDETTEHKRKRLYRI